MYGEGWLYSWRAARQRGVGVLVMEGEGTWPRAHRPSTGRGAMPFAACARVSFRRQSDARAALQAATAQVQVIRGEGAVPGCTLRGSRSSAWAWVGAGST